MEEHKERGEGCLCPGNGNRLHKFKIEKAETKTLGIYLVRGLVSVVMGTIVFEQLHSSE